mgnify:FL=1
MSNKPRTELQDQIKWWDNFNENLYFRICQIKSQLN